MTLNQKKTNNLPKFNIFFENDYCENEFLFDLNVLVKNTKKIMAFVLNDLEIIEKSCLKEYKYKSLTFDVVFCDDKKIEEINYKYRDKQTPTDVITFAIFCDTDENHRFVIDGDINLGEIIISVDTLIKNAFYFPHIGNRVLESKEIKINKEKPLNSLHPGYREIINELYFLICHGILHLLGFDHQNNRDYNVMVKLQKKMMECL